MDQLIVKAAATVTGTDRGEFTAIAAAYSLDRARDRIVPGAFADTIERWLTSGKMIPLHWNHEGDPQSIIGSIDPGSMREIPDEGLYVEGKLDLQESDMAREAWRSMKAGRMSLSFGYLIVEARKAGDDVQELQKLDLFEVSIVPAPANPDTRVLSIKSAEQLRDDADRLARQIEQDRLPRVPTPPFREPSPVEEALATVDPADDPVEYARRVAAAVQPLIPPPPEPPEPVDPEALRKNAECIAREHETQRLPAVSARDLTPIEKALRDQSPSTADDTVAVLDRLDAGDGLRLHVRAVTADETFGIENGLIKAVWSAAYINNLPDSAFLHIESGGSKDQEGKTTPRSLRHFPVRDADGNADLPHLRNALARIPQSNLPQEVKDRCVSMAQRMLDDAKSVDATDKAPVRAVDPLRERSEELALAFASGGMSKRRPPPAPAPPPEPDPAELDALRNQTREQVIRFLRH